MLGKHAAHTRMSALCPISDQAGCRAGTTAVTAAAMHRQHAAVQLLIQQGADPFEKGEDGASACDVAQVRCFGRHLAVCLHTMRRRADALLRRHLQLCASSSVRLPWGEFQAVQLQRTPPVTSLLSLGQQTAAAAVSGSSQVALR